MSLEVKHLTHTYSAGSAFQATAVHDVSLTIEDGEFVCIVGHTGSGKSTLVQHLNGLLKPTSGQVLVDGEDMNGENVDRRRISGGQMRRVAIAGVLAMEPKVLILDEPAAGLDPRGRERILGMLQELHREGGVTIVMVSHSMDDCARLATRMIVMSKGELVLTDTPRNVFRQADLMRSIGLGVPEAAELCGRLRAAGLQLPDDLFTQEELHDHLLRLWKEKQEKEAAK